MEKINYLTLYRASSGLPRKNRPVPAGMFCRAIIQYKIYIMSGRVCVYVCVCITLYTLYAFESQINRVRWRGKRENGIAVWYNIYDMNTYCYSITCVRSWDLIECALKSRYCSVTTLPRCTYSLYLCKANSRDLSEKKLLKMNGAVRK